MKSRIHVEHFPAERPLSPYMAAYYDSLLKSLRADQVHAVGRYRQARYQVQSGVTADTAYLDLSFDKPISNFDYFCQYGHQRFAFLTAGRFWRRRKKSQVCHVRRR